MLRRPSSTTKAILVRLLVDSMPELVQYLNCCPNSGVSLIFKSVIGLVNGKPFRDDDYIIILCMQSRFDAEFTSDVEVSHPICVNLRSSAAEDLCRFVLFP